MDYYIVSPAEIESGGPELAHQMCHQLLEMGHRAYMYYVYEGQKEPADTEACEKYRKYGTSHITDISEIEEDSVVIVPEGLTDWIQVIPSGRKVLWWMSVDNYIACTEEKDLDMIREMVAYHLVQSYYAKNYLLEHVGIANDKILFVSDYISEGYGQFVLPIQYRRNMALYNPKKGYEEINPLIEATPWLEWMPLIGLSEEQMIVMMQSAKVYVDFGNHPGKDRIPREAVSCGCCVVTNKKGSAAFYEDVPIADEYKFGDVHASYDKIAHLLKDICENYEEHARRFDGYRRFVLNEREQFAEDVNKMAEILDWGADRTKQEVKAMLSICIITKNEEKKLEKCLQHLKKLQAEIVVVDTGSTDYTPDVIKKYADIAGEFAWCDNFAKAKNYAASLASNDWVLTVDSDEYITSFDQVEINRIMEARPDVLGYVLRKNVYETRGEERVSTIWIPRLYNRKHYHYQGRIHEQLRRMDGKEIDNTCIKRTSITMDHDGYLGTPKQRREKAERNKQLLLLDLEEYGDEPYTLFQLGKSCYMAGEYAQAAEYFSRGLEFDLDPELEYVQDMVETYGYALLNSGQTETALGLEAVYDAFSNTADFIFLMGLIYMENGLLEAAVNEFGKAACMPEGKVTGTNSYLPYYNIGVIYECVGRKEEAEKYYRKCGKYEKALERIRQL